MRNFCNINIAEEGFLATASIVSRGRKLLFSKTRKNRIAGKNSGTNSKAKSPENISWNLSYKGDVFSFSIHRQLTGLILYFYSIVFVKLRFHNGVACVFSFCSWILRTKIKFNEIVQLIELRRINNGRLLLLLLLSFWKKRNEASAIIKFLSVSNIPIYLSSTFFFS